MKFTPEVIAALQTLKNAAENDFERHRIDVLEKDLTEPPKVEVIDEKHQKFGGVNFAKRANKGHFNANEIGIHRFVYTYYFGEIPKGCDIHHIDRDKSNNDISNLLMLTRSEHQKIHYPKGTRIPKIKKKFTCTFCGKEYEAFPNAQNLYCSEECKNKACYSRKKLETKNCVICGKEFYARVDKTNRKCCSRACAAKLLSQIAKNKHSSPQT